LFLQILFYYYFYILFIIIILFILEQILFNPDEIGCLQVCYN